MGILNKAELEAGGFSSAVDGYNRNRNVSVTAYGVLPGTNQVMNTLIQNAIIDASDNGFGGLIFPGGKFLVDPTTPILVPSNFTIEGLAEQTIFEVQNTNFPDSGTFPAVSKAIFAVGRIKDHPDHVGVTGWRRGDRYGRESGRRTIGSGATFNFTVTSGKVTAATIAAGGTLYRIGDRLNFDNGTYLIVSGVSNYEAGVITSIVIGNQGSGWGTATNPYTQTNTTGRNPSDRIFDLDSFADNVHFRNFVLDGKYGFGNIPLTGTKGYNGIDARGILRFSAKGITMRGFSETGLYVFDVKNAEIENNFADDCGWTGVFGRSRNGFSNIGLYSVTQPQLNTEYWIFKNNIARKCGDVGAQFSNVENFVVSGNTLLGCGTIGIEGESASFECWSTYTGNNGIRPPGTGVITDNIVDGLMLDGTLATDNTSTFNAVAIYGFNGISWTQGNEGVVREGRNIIRNLTSLGLKIARNTGGKIVGLGGTTVENVNNGANPTASPVTPGYSGTTQPAGGSDANTLQAVYLQAAEIWWAGNQVLSRRRGPGIYVSPAGGFLSAEVTDNYVEGATADTNSPAIHFRMTRSNTSRYLDFSRNRGDNIQTTFLRIEEAGTSNNLVRFVSIRANDIIVRNANRANIVGTPIINIRTQDGAKMVPTTIEIDRLTYLEQSASTNLAIPVKIENNSDGTAAALLSISSMVAPQFTTKYDIAGMGTAPTATRFANNS